MAAFTANLFWCLPQYALATGVLEQNLLPDIVGPNGSVVSAVSAVLPETSWWTLNAGRVVIVASILLVTTIVLVAGFLVLMLSDYRMSADMGLLSAITISLALIMDFLLLPAILLAADKR